MTPSEPERDLARARRLPRNAALNAARFFVSAALALLVTPYALSVLGTERFGLWVTFYPFDQDEYLDIVEQWLKSFGASSGEKAREEALQWALQRGSRSGRVAYQFARDWAGRNAKKK